MLGDPVISLAKARKTERDYVRGEAGETMPAEPAPSEPLRIDVVTEVEELQALRPSWEELRARTGQPPFASHYWVSHSWRCFCDGAEPFVLVARRGDLCVGIAPMMITRRSIGGIALRCIELIGSVYTPRFAILAEDRETERALLSTALDHGADVLFLRQLEHREATDQLLSELARERGRFLSDWRPAPSPYAELEGTFETYSGSLQKKLRSNIRNRRRRLEKIGPVSLDLNRGDERLEALLLQGYALEASGWKAREGTAILSDPDAASFFTSVAGDARDEGVLRLFFLNVGERPIAFAYCLEHDGTLLVIKQGYNPDYSAYGPSVILQYEAIAWCYANGLREYDLLGDDESWKMLWAHGRREHRWYYLFSPTPRGRLAYWSKSTAIPFAQGLVSRGRRAAQPVARRARDAWATAARMLGAHAR